MIFFGNLISEILFKMTFHVLNSIKTCQREQVNKLSQNFVHAKFPLNNFILKFYEGMVNWKIVKHISVNKGRAFSSIFLSKFEL